VDRLAVGGVGRIAMLVAGNHTSIVTPSAIAAAGVRVGDEATATGELLGEDDEDFVDVDDFALDTQGNSWVPPPDRARSTMSSRLQLTETRLVGSTGRMNSYSLPARIIRQPGSGTSHS